jgi:hypothetical protein
LATCLWPIGQRIDDHKYIGGPAGKSVTASETSNQRLQTCHRVEYTLRQGKVIDVAFFPPASAAAPPRTRAGVFGITHNANRLGPIFMIAIPAAIEIDFYHQQ